MHTATPLDDVDESVAALRTGLVGAIPLVVIAVGLVVWWLVGRTLRPVARIRAEVADITGSTLGRRVPEPGTNDEIDRLAHTMNEMLDRVETSTERQRRFVADASHELRSPLTRMHAELEVDLEHPQGADFVATHRSVLEEVTNLEQLVNDLLDLARSDNGATARRWEAIDLDDLVMDEAGRLRPKPGVAIDTSGVSGAQVVGDASQLTRVVRNLTDNAVRHARARVVFVTREHDDIAELSVTDDGPGIPTAERSYVFERFTRLDAARDRASGGSGLGLAIVRDIVEAHGGAVRIEEPPEGGTSVFISLPTRARPRA